MNRAMNRAMNRTFKLLLILLMGAPVSSVLAHSNDRHSGVSLGAASGDLADRHIGLENGFGAREFTLDRTHANYAAYVDQGMAMLNVFHYIDALRSFREADTLNPSALLPAAGLIIAYVHLDPRNSAGLIADLIRKKDALIASSKQDQLWYEFAKGVYAAYTGQPGGEDLLRRTHQALSKEFPQDVEVLALGSWLAGNYQTGPYLRALELEPRAVGPAHYLTHLLESRGDFAGALPMAVIVADQATRSAHAQHMLGHLLPHLKRWSEANVQFAKAHAIHLEWAKVNGVQPKEDWHYSHNLNLWSVALAGVGDVEKALEMMSESCQFDGRACLDLMKAAIGVGQFDFAEQLAASLPAGFEPHIRPFRAELRLLRGTATFNEVAQDLAPLREMAQILEDIYNTEPDSAKEATVASKVANFINTKTMEAGFDSWGDGFFAGLRISQAAHVRGLLKVKDSAKAMILEVAPEFDFTKVVY